MEYYKGILPIYEKNSAESMPVTSFFEDAPWRCGLGLPHLFVEDFRPETLDPYIKDYVLTLIKLGMQTVGSCDGWHTRHFDFDKNMDLRFLDRYSSIWHRILFDDAVSHIRFNRYPFRWKERKNIRFLYFNLPKEDEKKFDIYLRLKLVTDYLKLHADEYMEKLTHLRNIVNSEYRNIDDMSTEEVRDLFRKVFQETEV